MKAHKERKRSQPARRERLALLLPAHNEELILATTIQSAITAGMEIDDIYVVDDDSHDKTREIAIKAIGKQNVLSVPRSGKARAVKQAFDFFNLEPQYEWLHVADADSIFCSDYFRIYRTHLDGGQWCAAVGFVQSMGGNWLANYRSFSYTYGQHIFRRIQSWFGIIAVLPGPVTCFRTDIIKKLEFEVESLTEDFDLTMQIHRKHLGRIKFIPEAVNYTQDPRTLKDFYGQTLRWQRGFFQGVRKYRIATRPHFIDLGIGYQLSESVYYFLQFTLILPFLVMVTHSYAATLTLLIADYTAICFLALFSAAAVKRPIILTTLPYYYVLRLLELVIFLQAFVEIIIMRRHSTVPRGWSTEGRRYSVAINEIEAMQ